jgi:hypothetical protein
VAPVTCILCQFFLIAVLFTPPPIHPKPIVTPFAGRATHLLHARFQIG